MDWNPLFPCGLYQFRPAGGGLLVLRSLLGSPGEKVTHASDYCGARLGFSQRFPQQMWWWGGMLRKESLGGLRKCIQGDNDLSSMTNVPFFCHDPVTDPRGPGSAEQRDMALPACTHTHGEQGLGPGDHQRMTPGGGFPGNKRQTKRVRELVPSGSMKTLLCTCTD